MQPTSVAFTGGAFLVEVEPDFRNPQSQAWVAFLSLLEDGGTLLRPLVGQDGDRFVLQAQSEPVAMDLAMNFLRRQFGRRRGPERPWLPARMQWGPPVVVKAA